MNSFGLWAMSAEMIPSRPSFAAFTERIAGKVVAGCCGVALVVVLIIPCMSSCSLSDRPKGVSIVLVVVDTLRADHLGCYGGGIPTPNLDRLAGEGSLFLDTTAQSPLTLPSHSSILTGTTPIYHRVRDNGRFQLPEKIDTLAEILKSSGYRTAAFVGGLPVHSRFGLSQGFDTYDDSFRRPLTEKKADEVVAAARDWMERRDGELFFLWVHLFDPHTPYEPPQQFSSRYGDTYEGEVAYVDHALGDLFSSLPSDVLMVATSDHGESLGEHGEDAHALFIYDATLRVPLIFRGPGVPSGAVIRDQARSIDIVPTILDLVGRRDMCGACQGRSLLALMQGEDGEPEASYAETYFPRLNLGWSELRSIRKQGWKYIAAPEPELYNLTSDPGELENLATDEPERLEELASELSAIEKEAAGPVDVSPISPDRKTLDALRSLGYVSSQNVPPRTGPLPDPKSRIALWRSLMKAVDALDRSDGPSLDQAIVDLEAILQQDSGMLLARGYLSEAYFKRGLYEAAVSQCLRFLATDPNDFQATYLLGESLIRLGRDREAEKAFEKAAALDTSTPGPLARLANLHMKRGEMGKARRILDSALERDSQDASVLLVQGRLLIAEGDRQKAEEALRDSLAADPLEVATQVELANLLIAQTRFDDAEKLLGESVAVRPTSAVLHMTLGRARAMSGRPERAIPSFQRALELEPESILVMNSLGFAYLETNAVEKGVEYLKRSLALNPQQPQIRSLVEKYSPPR